MEYSSQHPGNRARRTVIALFAAISFCCAPVFAADYATTVASWSSPEEVANWLQSNFEFDKSRQITIKKRLKQQGPSGLLIRSPEKLYNSRSGYCGDSANFALQSLNNIDPEYNAQWVFVENARGRPNHWVTGYYVDDKLYIMDYGTGRKWRDMQGTHGPYESLDEYRDYLVTLSLPGFSVGDVWFRDMPGTED